MRSIRKNRETQQISVKTRWYVPCSLLVRSRSFGTLEVSGLSAMTQPSTPQHRRPCHPRSDHHDAPPHAAIRRLWRPTRPPRAPMRRPVLRALRSPAKPGSGVAHRRPIHSRCWRGRSRSPNRKGAQVSGVYSGETTEVEAASRHDAATRSSAAELADWPARRRARGRGPRRVHGRGAFSLAVSGTLATDGQEDRSSARR